MHLSMPPHREKFHIPKLDFDPCVERLKSTLGILMWFVVSTVIAYHIGILDQNPMPPPPPSVRAMPELGQYLTSVTCLGRGGLT